MASKPVALKWLILEKLPLLALAAFSCLLTVRAQSNLMMPLEEFTIAVRLKNALVTYVHYLIKMLWPNDLALHYPHPGDSLSLLQVCGAVILLAGISLAAISERFRRPYLTVGWFWYLGTLVPVIGLIQVATQSRADRYTYIPLLGIFLALTWGLAELATHWRLERMFAKAAGIVVLACAALTWGQVHYWNNGRTLWAHSLAVTGEGNSLAHNGLGVALLASGELDLARQEFVAALETRPTYADAHYNLGLVELRQQNVEAAIRCFSEALHCSPKHPRAPKSLGLSLLQANRFAEARHYLGKAQEVDPRDPAVQFGLARCLEADAKVTEAEEKYRTAIALAPQDALYHRELALILQKEGRDVESRQEYDLSLRLQPNWPDNAIRQVWILAAHPQTDRRNAAEACRLADQACGAIREPRAEFLDGRAAACAAVGRFQQAAAMAEEAIKLAQAAGRRDLAERVQQRRSIYLRGSSFCIPGDPADFFP